MDELEQLIQQKKEIEKKIKELKGNDVKFGYARLSKYSVPSPRQGEFRIMVKTQLVAPHLFEGEEGRWVTIISSFSELNAADAISSLINDLRSLQEFILKGENDTQVGRERRGSDG